MHRAVLDATVVDEAQVAEDMRVRRRYGSARQSARSLGRFLFVCLLVCLPARSLVRLNATLCGTLMRTPTHSRAQVQELVANSLGGQTAVQRRQPSPVLRSTRSTACARNTRVPACSRYPFHPQVPPSSAS